MLIDRSHSITRTAVGHFFKAHLGVAICDVAAAVLSIGGLWSQGRSLIHRNKGSNAVRGTRHAWYFVELPGRAQRQKATKDGDNGPCH